MAAGLCFLCIIHKENIIKLVYKLRLFHDKQKKVRKLLKMYIFAILYSLAGQYWSEFAQLSRGISLNDSAPASCRKLSGSSSLVHFASY